MIYAEIVGRRRFRRVVAKHGVGREIGEMPRKRL